MSEEVCKKLEELEGSFYGNLSELPDDVREAIIDLLPGFVDVESARIIGWDEDEVVDALVEHIDEQLEECSWVRIYLDVREVAEDVFEDKLDWGTLVKVKLCGKEVWIEW